MQGIFQRCETNPIITAEDTPMLAEAVTNPGATEQDGQVVLLVRIERNTGESDIHVARSSNGVDCWELSEKPLIEHGLPDMKYEQWGCEDARVVYLEEERRWYITYTAYSPGGAAVGLARSDDLETVERVGLIFSPNNKDAAIFPRKIHGRWTALHRPSAGNGLENIWIAHSQDLIYWGEPHCVLPEGQGADWDSVTVGAGPPPVETDEGWLLLYHGVKMYGGNRVYRVGTALLDSDKPHRVRGRSKGCIFKPTEDYETTGLMPNVVFPTGLLRRGDELWMYYGAADTCIGLAVAKLDDVMQTLLPVHEEDT